MSKITHWLVAIAILFTTTSCKKYLAEKSDKKLVIPASLKDVQALLDDYPRMSQGDIIAQEISADDYWLSDKTFNTYKAQQRMYLWEKDFIFDPGYNDWSRNYAIVYTANTVLEYTAKIARDEFNKAEWNNVTGQAYYHRGKSFFDIAATWALAYDPATAATVPGIPLRLNTQFNEPSTRASLQATFQQVIGDLENAIRLLPVVPVTVLRPSKPAAYGMLARAYWYMGNYGLAGLYADSCLQLNNKLIDYNTIDSTTTYPFRAFNDEVISVHTFAKGVLYNFNAKIDSVLFGMYSSNDLRKSLFFTTNADGTAGFRGSYFGSESFQHGIATDEMYLIRAEANARAGKPEAALRDLNELLEKRWRTGTFIPYTTNTQNGLLDLVLKERRKELLMRGLRWMDVKRLNREGTNIVMQRKIKGNVYTLPPNDKRYAMAIPEDVITLSGIAQNPR
jgi:tetratricopeptide (TPR) repeat protein